MRRIYYFLTVFFTFIFFFNHTSFSQNCANTSVGLTPINDLGTGYYRSIQGGLYPSGSNSRPLSHNNAGVSIAHNVLPLDTAGNYDPVNGKIVLLSVGMSNCTQEFSTFMSQANALPNKNPKLILVDGAQGGQSIDVIINPNAMFWTIILQRLAAAGVSAKQVQAVWFKEAQANPTDTSFPGYPVSLKNKFKTVMGIMKAKYMNPKLCYNASRIYAGYATSSLNPEPYAHYSGWSVKWLIEDQLNGDTSLTYSGTNAKSPWLSWGPYLWADGTTPRLDGLTWICPTDYNPDGTHPSTVGRTKVASMLTNFFTTDETTKPWFLRTITLNIAVAMQGFYNTSTGRLNMRDTVTAYLHNNASPYNMIDSARGVIDSILLRAPFKYYSSPTDTYYIHIMHRNSIETWSRAGGVLLFYGGITNYNFLDSASKAYGNNLILRGTRYCIYSGDIDQDGVVDAADVVSCFNDASGFLSGYIPSDVTGDNSTDVSDLIIVYNNSIAFVGKITP